jgi:hypothetical protein
MQVIHLMRTGMFSFKKMVNIIWMRNVLCVSGRGEVIVMDILSQLGLFHLKKTGHQLEN